MGLFECDTGISVRALADKITSCVRAYGLALSNLRGQAYDGAGNMAGSVNCTAALIASDYPLAIYLHCTSHCLNLTVMKLLQLNYQCSQHDGHCGEGIPFFLPLTPNDKGH